eukprot:sb/3470503/
MDVILGCLRSIEGNRKGYNGVDVMDVLGRVVAGVRDDVVDGVVCDVIWCYAKQKSGTNPERYCSRYSHLLSSLLDRQSEFVRQKTLVTLAYLARVTPYPNIIRDLPVRHKTLLKTFLSRRGHETTLVGEKEGRRKLPKDQFKPASHGTRYNITHRRRCSLYLSFSLYRPTPFFLSFSPPLTESLSLSFSSGWLQSRQVASSVV